MATEQNGVAVADEQVQSVAAALAQSTESAGAVAQPVVAEAVAPAQTDAGQLDALRALFASLDEQRDSLMEQIRAAGGTTGRRGRPKGSKNRKPSKAKAKPKAKAGKRGRPAGSKNKAPRASKRASNETSLIVSVAQALSNAKEPMNNTQICEAVEAAGYQTKAGSFKTMVAQSLVKLNGLRVGNSHVVNRPSHGHYVAGSGMAAYLADPSKAVVIEE
jgi:hypothetical protein